MPPSGGIFIRGIDCGLWPSLVVGPQAAGAQVNPLRPPLYLQTYAVNVGHLAHVGPSLGVADVVPKHTRLTAYPALGHGISSQ